MEWGVEQSALAVVGALFLLVLTLTFTHRLAATTNGRVAIATSAAAYVAAAFALPSIEEARLGAFAWFIPLVPLIMVAASATKAVHSMWERVVHHAPASSSSVSAGAAAPGGTERLMLRRALDPSTPATELADLAYGHPELRARVAANPSTPSSVLGWLATAGDDSVRSAIASRETYTESKRAG